MLLLRRFGGLAKSLANGGLSSDHPGVMSQVASALREGVQAHLQGWPEEEDFHPDSWQEPDYTENTASTANLVSGSLDTSQVNSKSESGLYKVTGVYSFYMEVQISEHLVLP